MEIKPNKQERQVAKKMQKLFNFETDIYFNIYDYGERKCIITIEASHEASPMCNSSERDYGRVPNSARVAQYARLNFHTG